MAPSARPLLSITLPTSTDLDLSSCQPPKTPDQREDTGQHDHLTIQPPPPPRPQFKVKRKRATRLSGDSTMALPTGIIPTIEMSEAPSGMSSPTLPTSPSLHLLSPLPISAAHPRALTPPKTPAPRLHPIYNQAESPAEEWGLINNIARPFERSNSICSSFSDSSISSAGSSAFSLPYSGYDSPESESADPFLDDASATKQKHDALLTSPDRLHESPKPKRTKIRRDIKWTPQMDEHLWLTFSARLSDPKLTPFKMLPGSHPPMGVCDQVATTAKKTWGQVRRSQFDAPSSIDTVVEAGRTEREGSPDTIRPSSLLSMQPKWPKVAATRRRLRQLCAKRPSISAHYQRMLRTRSPSPFESTPPVERSSVPPSSVFSGHDLKLSLVTATAPSMQPNGPLAQLSSDEPTPEARPQRLADSFDRVPRSQRTTDWFDRIPRSKAHQKSASLQSELRLDDTPTAEPAATLDSPFDMDAGPARFRLLRSMAATKSLGRTEFNGKSLDAPVEFRLGAPTDRRSRKRRFRSDEEKPKRLALDDIFAPQPESSRTARTRGLSLGTAQLSDPFTMLATPASSGADQEMAEAPSVPNIFDDVPLGCRSVPRRLAEPVPRLGSPFMPLTSATRQHNTFPRSSLIPSFPTRSPFNERLMQLATLAKERESS